MTDKKDHKTLKRFDMYRFVSRKDVILAIVFIVGLLILLLYLFLFSDQVV